MVNEHICSNFLPSLVKSGMSVNVLRCAPVGPRFGHSLVRIQGPHDLCETELANIKDRVGSWCSVELSKTAPGDYIAMISNHDCAICHLISNSHCFLESCSMKEDGTLVWNLVGPDADSIRRLIGGLKETGREVKIHCTREQESRNALTFRQKQALLLAFDMVVISPLSTILPSLVLGFHSAILLRLHPALDLFDHLTHVLVDVGALDPFLGGEDLLTVGDGDPGIEHAPQGGEYG